MLRHAPARMRTWVGQQLGRRVPSPARYRDVAAEVHAAFSAVAAIDLTDLQTIIHHFDVYHVEVKVVDALKSHVELATKTTRKLPDRLPGAKVAHPKYVAKPVRAKVATPVGPKLPGNHAG
eukprot:698437-Prymnesium_polylepis.1